MTNVVELKQAIHIRTAMEEYQESVYLNIMRKLNSDCQNVLSEDLGTEFVKNCGRDFAGEIVRNCFDASNYYITVDQLATRILEFSYDSDYDPLAENGGIGEIQKSVYNYGELRSSELDKITSTMKNSQKKLFTESRKQDSLDRHGKQAYRDSNTDSNGDVYDELTGLKGTKSIFIRNGKEVMKSDLQSDHIQSREAATSNARFVNETGRQQLREFWNSSDNMQMMHASANASKGDVRVCQVNGKIKYVNARSKEYDPATDITFKATPEQLAEAVCKQWEAKDSTREGGNSKKIEKLKEKGYLNENGKVPKSVKKELVKNIRHSQNQESKIILQNAKYYDEIKDEAMESTKASIGKIIAGQVIYYAAPPLLYEVKQILKAKDITIDNALDKIGRSAKRVVEYVISKLKYIFVNVAFNSLKKFIKSFMDVLIQMLKATVKKMMKMAKHLVLCTVDAVRIIADKNSSRAERADAVCNLYGVTITACVVEVMFEIIGEMMHIPEPFDDIIFGPLQILVTVMSTNLIMLILKKADLFDVQLGFKMSKIRKLFIESRQEYEDAYQISEELASEQIQALIRQAKRESIAIYENLCEFNPYKDSARPELEKINTMFSINIDFDKEWLRFLGVPV